ncbi:unnamed protein product [Closterium sp. Naga37s-1]|nr:unnamed protein product [Closterium sp. Naga37s-1]
MPVMHSRARSSSVASPPFLALPPTPCPSHPPPVAPPLPTAWGAMGVTMGSLFMHVGRVMAGLQSRFASAPFPPRHLPNRIPHSPLRANHLHARDLRGAYRTAPYVRAATLTTLLLFILLSLALAAPLYWMVGPAPSATAFAVFIAMLCMAFAVFITTLCLAFASSPPVGALVPPVARPRWPLIVT